MNQAPARGRRWQFGMTAVLFVVMTSAICFWAYRVSSDLARVQSSLGALSDSVEETNGRLQGIEVSLGSSLDVYLPPNSVAKPMIEQEQIFVDLAPTGEVSVRGVATDPVELFDSLAAEVPKPAIVIRVDAACEFRHVQRMLDQCHRAGISSYNLAAKRE